MHFTAVIVSIDHWAQIPKCPSMVARKAWNACSVDFEEVETVHGIVVRDTSEEDEEHHRQSTCDEEEGEQGEERSCSMSIEVLLAALADATTYGLPFCAIELGDELLTGGRSADEQFVL